MSASRELFTSLQAGRAFAALLVVLYHNALYIFALDKYWGYDPSYHLFNFGHAGVEFFFVLSGFIILHIHWNDLNQPSQFFSFIKKRFIRIYPIYWLVLMMVVPVYFLVPSFGFPYHRDPVNILSSIVLIYANDSLRSEVAVAWTLYHEILFYFVFALAILNRRFGLLVLALWLSVSVIALFMNFPPYLAEYLFSPLHLLFGMGMLICTILRQSTIKNPAVVAIAGLIVFLATGMEEDYSLWFSENTRNLLYGFGSAAALLGAIELERQGRLHIPKWLQLMGDASYSIYLTHFTALSLLAKLFVRFGGLQLPDLLSFVLLPLMTVLLGIAVHWFVERPLLRKLRRYRKPTMVSETAYAAA
jgi:exopolysaccharide production protein ExoZ